MPFYNRTKRGIPLSKKLENLSEKNGLRKVIFDICGDQYIGEWKNNEKSGKGVSLTRNNKELYEGDFKNNFRHGFGVLAYRLPTVNVFSLVYRGDWENGKMHGSGLRVYVCGDFYSGEWKNGKRDGYGQMWYGDGSFYDGDWVKDVRQGLGLLVEAGGNRYEGSWFDDKKHGKGRFYFLDCGQMQEGVWFNNACTFSTICNLPYRQAALKPTIYPIQPTGLVDMAQICASRESQALQGLGEVCLGPGMKHTTSESLAYDDDRKTN